MSQLARVVRPFEGDLRFSGPWLSLLCLLWLAAPVPAERPPEPPAPRVATGSSTLWASAAAANESGDFVIAWYEPHSPSPRSPEGYVGQRFSVTGRRLGAAFPLSVSSSLAGRPALSFVSPTRFAAVVTHASPEGEVELAARVFDVAGSPTGGWFRIAGPLLNATSFSPQAVAEAGGDLSVVWQTGSSGVWQLWGRRFAGDGSPLTDPIRISEPLLIKPEPVVAAAGGELIVAWADGAERLVGRVFGSGGGHRRQGFVIAEESSAFAAAYDVAAAGGGRFLAAWLGHAEAGAGVQIYGRWLDAAGEPLSARFAIASETEPFVGPLEHASVALATDPAGGFLVTWLGRRPDDTEAVFGRFFDAETGLPLESEFPLSEPATSSRAGNRLHNTSLSFHREIGYFATWLDRGSLESRPEASRGKDADGVLWAGWLQRPVPLASPLTGEEVACEGERLRRALERLQVLPAAESKTPAERGPATRSGITLLPAGPASFAGLGYRAPETGDDRRPGWLWHDETAQAFNLELGADGSLAPPAMPPPRVPSVGLRPPPPAAAARAPWRGPGLEEPGLEELGLEEPGPGASCHGRWHDRDFELATLLAEIVRPGGSAPESTVAIYRAEGIDSFRIDVLPAAAESRQACPLTIGARFVFDTSPQPRGVRLWLHGEAPGEPVVPACEPPERPSWLSVAPAVTAGPVHLSPLARGLREAWIELSE